MAYRGSSSRNSSSNTKRPLTPTDAFDSKFTDFGGGNSASSSTKRQRTNTGGNAKPLKFGNQPTQIIAPISELKNAPPVTNKPVYRPILPSQKERESNLQPSPDDDWGDLDDDDNDLFIAASQAVEDDRRQQEDEKANDEVLAAMSALLEDDDDDFDFEPINKAPDRLNQTLVNFGPKNPVFKEPALPPTKEELHQEEIEKLKKQQIKAQGEASMLRGELNKQTKEFSLERVNLRRTETDLRDKLREQQKKIDEESSRAKTEKLFLLQEMQQLREQLTKMNSERKTRESQMIQEVSTKKRRVLDDLKTDRNSFPCSKDFSKYVTTKTSETQTVASRRRTCTLKPIDKVRSSALVFSQMVEAPDSVNASLLQMDSISYHFVVPKLVLNLIDDLKADHNEEASNDQMVEEPGWVNVSLFSPTPYRFPKKILKPIDDDSKKDHIEVASNAQLNVIFNILCLWGETLKDDDCVHVTEACSKLIRKMIRYDDYRPLLLVLKIISSMWKRKLQDIDITNDIIEVLVQTFESKMIQDIFDAEFIIVICDLLCHVTIDRDQSKVICGSAEVCLLTSIMRMIHSNIQLLDDGDLRNEALEKGFRALSSWLHQSLTVSHPLPWISYECKECTSAVTRCYVLFTQCQVDRFVTHNETETSLMSSLEKCVQVLSWLQSRFAKVGGVGWAKVFGEDATAARRYVWSVESLQKKDMEPYVSRLLNNLIIEVTENFDKFIKA